MSRPREVEKKWLVDQPPASYATLSVRFAKYFLDKGLADADKLLYADTIDNYWHAHPEAKADIVRLRHSWGYWQSSRPALLKEFTVKQKDKGCNIDRVEINNDVSSIESFRSSLNLSLKKKFTLRKDEVVVWIPGDIVIGLSKVWLDGQEDTAKVVFEIEGPDLSLVEGAEAMLKYAGLMKDCVYEPRSLLEIFDDLQLL